MQLSFSTFIVLKWRPWQPSRMVSDFRTAFKCDDVACSYKTAAVLQTSWYPRTKPYGVLELLWSPAGGREGWPGDGASHELVSAAEGWRMCGNPLQGSPSTLLLLFFKCLDFSKRKISTNDFSELRAQWHLRRRRLLTLTGFLTQHSWRLDVWAPQLFVVGTVLCFAGCSAAKSQ